MLLRYLERHAEEHGATKPDAMRAFYVTVECCPLVQHTISLARRNNGRTCFPNKDTKSSPYMLLWWH